ESDVKRLDRVVVVSTSTLEIGIDIGDIDLVVLDGPPPDVPAFLQRIGRGNRRTGYTRVMPCSATVSEAIVQAAMLDAARNGRLGATAVGAQASVARQQVASAILEGSRRSAPRGQIADLMRSCLPDVE